MFVKSLCNSCFQTYVLMFETHDIELVKQISDKDGHTCPCPRLCGGKINLVGDSQIAEMSEKLRLRDPIVITGRQLFQAVNGLGLPDEMPTIPEVAQAHLEGRKVLKATIETIEGKLYLHELSLENGITVHLAAGSRGAQILKITKDKDGA